MALITKDLGKLKKHPCLNEDTNEFNCKYVKYFKYDKEDESRLINIFHIIGYAWTDDMKDSYSKDKSELLVVYETCYQTNIGDERNQIYTRKFSNFLAKVNKEKDPDSKQEYIFEPCNNYEIMSVTHDYYSKKERESRTHSDIEAFNKKPFEGRLSDLKFNKTGADLSCDFEGDIIGVFDINNSSR